MALALHLNDGDEAVRACEAVIFEHWFGNTRAELDREYAPYDDASVFLALSDGDETVGVVRLVGPSPAGLKTLHDAVRPPWSLDVSGVDPQTWEVATMGILPGRRNPLYALALYHGLAATGRANHVRHMVAILDERVRSILGTAGLDFPAMPGATPEPYLGSPASVPVYVDFPAMMARQREVAPRMYATIGEAHGLAGVELPDFTVV